MAKTDRELMQLLLKTSPNDYEAFLTFDDSIVDMIAEIAHNILYNNVIKLSDTDKELLRKYKKDLQLLGTQEVDVSAKRKVLLKNGTVYIPTLLKVALPYAPSDASMPTTVLANMDDEKVLTKATRDRGRCRHCNRVNDRKTSLKCSKCKQPVCAKHVIGPCCSHKVDDPAVLSL